MIACPLRRDHTHVPAAGRLACVPSGGHGQRSDRPQKAVPQKNEIAGWRKTPVQEEVPRERGMEKLSAAAQARLGLYRRGGTAAAAAAADRAGNIRKIRIPRL